MRWNAPEPKPSDVIVAATGDDKANLVISLLAKTEYGVPRTVARVNNPKSEWLFDETWGGGRGRIDTSLHDGAGGGGRQRGQPGEHLPLPPVWRLHA